MKNQYSYPYIYDAEVEKQIEEMISQVILSENPNLLIAVQL